jgi:hypothetical protein
MKERDGDDAQMPEFSPPEPALDADPDEIQLGLSLSELLGEVWTPVHRPSSGSGTERSAPGDSYEAEPGEPATWSL